jgi:hypothetical protein
MGGSGPATEKISSRRTLMKRVAAWALLGLLAGATMARAEGPSLGLGAGVVSTEATSNTVYVTGNFRVPLVPFIALEPEVGYWKKDYSFLGATVSAQDLSFGGNALAIIPIHPVSLWAGAGVGAHELKGSFNVPGLGSGAASATQLGVHLLGGVDFDVAPRVKIFGAARYDTIHENPRSDDIHETKFYGGVRLVL